LWVADLGSLRSCPVQEVRPDYETKEDVGQRGAKGYPVQEVHPDYEAKEDVGQRGTKGYPCRYDSFYSMLHAK
jgi:hypothetical protein